MKKRGAQKTNWANVLTWTRLVLIVPITATAYFQFKWVVLTLFLVAMATDYFDGFVARRTGVASDAGARFDSQVDNAMLPFFLVWLWLLFPTFFVAFGIPIALVVAFIAMQLFVAKWKLGSYTGLHLWSDKASAVGGFVLLPALIIFGLVPWLAWTVCVVSIIASVEGTLYLLKGGKNLDARWVFDK